MRKTFMFNGKRYEVSGKNQRDIDDKYFYKRLELESLGSLSEYTVREWGDIWVETYKRPAVCTRNFKMYKGILNNHIYPYIGEKNLAEVTKNDCQSIINRCESFAAAYISRITDILKGIFNSALEEGHINDNPAKKLIKPKGRVSHRRSLTKEEQILFLKTAEISEHGLYFKIMYYCGLRPSECSYIQGKDIVGNTLHVRGTKSENSDRYVIIPDKLKFPELKEEAYLFPNLNDTKRKRWWNSFKREMNIVGGCKLYRNQVVPPYVVADDISPYCLRHTFCTNLEAAGVPLNVARQLMGHSSVELTAKIYTHTSEEAWNSAAEKINQSHNLPLFEE